MVACGAVFVGVAAVGWIRGGWRLGPDGLVGRWRRYPRSELRGVRIERLELGSGIVGFVVVDTARGPVRLVARRGDVEALDPIVQAAHRTLALPRSAALPASPGPRWIVGVGAAAAGLVFAGSGAWLAPRLVLVLGPGGVPIWSVGVWIALIGALDAVGVRLLVPRRDATALQAAVILGTFAATVALFWRR
jgi:hypothetical protein